MKMLRSSLSQTSVWLTKTNSTPSLHLRGSAQPEERNRPWETIVLVGSLQATGHGHNTIQLSAQIHLRDGTITYPTTLMF